MAYQPVDVVAVRCWGEMVGAIALDPASGFYVFEYDSRWRRRGIEIAPLTMPTTASRATFVFPALSPVTYQRLPAALADSLPDAFGNAIVDAALAAQGVGREQITPLDRLAYLGRRGIGALEFQPDHGPRQRTTTAIELSDLVSAARAALRGEFSSDKESEAALRQLIAVGTSAGGQRAKAVVAWNRQTGAIRSGQVDELPEGFEHWLLKFDGVGVDMDLGVSQHYGRIELAYSQMAAEAGIAISECRLLEEGGRAHFMTRRFDRADGEERETGVAVGAGGFDGAGGAGGGKVHVQTLCAMAELDYNQIGTHAYEQLLLTIHRLDLGRAALGEAFRRVVFNVLAVNRDDHTKNLAFVCASDGQWTLSPAYDLTFAHNPSGRWTQVHQMSVGGKFVGISRADVLAMADRFDVPGAKAALKHVAEVVRDWRRFAAGVDLPAEVTSHIAAEHAEVREVFFA